MTKKWTFVTVRAAKGGKHKVVYMNESRSSYMTAATATLKKTAEKIALYLAGTYGLATNVQPRNMTHVFATG